MIPEFSVGLIYREAETINVYQHLWWVASECILDSTRDLTHFVTVLILVKLFIHLIAIYYSKGPAVYSSTASYRLLCIHAYWGGGACGCGDDSQS